MRAVWAIVRREVLAEIRSREILPAILVFGTLVVVVMNFAFEPTREESELLAPGVLWVSIAFSGILGLSRSAALDEENGALDGLLAAPIDRASLYVGKMLANLAFLVMAEIVLVPLFLVMYNVASWTAIARLAPTIFLGTVGFIAAGTIFATIAANSKLREVLLPILLLPVIIPLFLAAVEATGIVLRNEEMRRLVSWLRILAVFDLVYLVASTLLFEFVLED
jgi:heme exporter protein B